MTSRSLVLFALALTCLHASAVEAAPARSTAKKSPASAYEGKPTAQRGRIASDATTLPSLEERKSAALAVLGKNVALQLVWASPSVRRPFVQDRAALLFGSADVVDARAGIASWSSTASFDLGFSLCELFGCPGDDTGSTPPAHALQLWVNASAGKKYLAVCRVKLAGKKGDVVIESDGGFELTHHVDHTGKSSGKVSWLVDPSGAGWYGFSVSASVNWSTSGCTVDEI